MQCVNFRPRIICSSAVITVYLSWTWYYLACKYTRSFTRLTTLKCILLHHSLFMGFGFWAKNTSLNCICSQVLIILHGSDKLSY